MVIRNAADVENYLIDRFDDIAKLAGEDRELVLTSFLALYHEMQEAKRYKYEYRSARTENKKSDIKWKFDLAVDLAKKWLESIEEYLSRVKPE